MILQLKIGDRPAFIEVSQIVSAMVTETDTIGFPYAVLLHLQGTTIQYFQVNRQDAEDLYKEILLAKLKSEMPLKKKQEQLKQ